MTTGDRVRIRGLELVLICGVLPEEQARAQPFRLDLDLHLDLGPAGRADDLSLTVDYGAVAQLLAERLGAGRFHLVEAVAEEAAELVFGSGNVEAVTVTVTKLRPPIALNVATTGVTIHRVRADRPAAQHR